MSTKKITILKRDYSNCSTDTPVPLCPGNMETDDSSKNKSQELNEEPGPSQGSQCAPSQLEQALQEALMDEKEESQYLASQNAALKEQMAAKELSWEKEKKQLMKALESPSTNPNQAHMWRMIKKKEQQIRSLEKDLQEQVMETKRVTEYWKAEYDRVTAFWKEENDRITEIWENETEAIKAASYKDLMAMSAEWEQRWHVQQEEDFIQMEALQEETDKKVKQVVLEKDDLITKITNEKKVLEAQCAESSAKLKEKEQEFMNVQAEWNSKHQSLQASNSNLDAELKETSAKLKDKEQEFINSQAEWNRTRNQFVLEKNDLVTFTNSERDILQAELKKTSAKLEDKATHITQREVEWQAKCKALQDQLKCEVAEKEASVKRIQELEREGRQEGEWLHKATQMEENIKLLTQRNNQLQVLSLLTDKEKAKIKKEANKAKKEAEKKLKKERKEREEREKKERKENEKKERERLEREKKEQKLREKKEKEKKKAKG